MKLSDVVAYLNELERTDLASVSASMVRELENVVHVVQSNEIDLVGYKVRVNSRLKSVRENLDQFESVFNSLKQELASTVARLERPVFGNDYSVYNEVTRWEPNEYVLNRKLKSDDESALLLHSRLKNYTDWRVPGMILRPGIETFIEDMVPLDPLYVVDHNSSLIEPALAKFNDVYRNRLRDYVINEDHDQILGALPTQQFGTVFAHNFFNYKPYELIVRYLNEIWHKLREGGVLVMTFNDCDWAHGVQLVESKLMTYVPGQRLRRAAEDIGFEELYYHRGQGDLVWVELQKPGAIRSIRGGQTLAKIQPK